MNDKVKNKLIDLNDHLFEQMERLNDDELKGENLAREIERAKSMTSIASQIISNARLALDAQTAIHDYMIKRPPAMLGMKGCHEKED